MAVLDLREQVTVRLSLFLADDGLDHVSALSGQYLVQAILFDCPPNMLETWWVPLQDEFEVLLFNRDARAIAMAKKLIGEMIWSDSFIEKDAGGLVITNGVTIWVSVRRNAPGLGMGRDKRYEPFFYCSVLLPMRLLSWQTGKERKALHQVVSALARGGIKRKSW